VQITFLPIRDERSLQIRMTIKLLPNPWPSWPEPDGTVKRTETTSPWPQDRLRVGSNTDLAYTPERPPEESVAALA